MEVLRQCTRPDAYSYTPVTPKEDSVRIKDEDELYAAIPIYAAKFEGKLRTAGQLSVEMTIVGSYESGQNRLSRSDFEGECADATHFISAITAGAFEFSAGGSAEVGADVEVAGAGAGARSSAEREVLNRDGYKKACSEASSEDEAPPEGCGALLRVEVVAMRKGADPASEEDDSEQPPVLIDEPAAVGPGVVKVHIESDDSAELISLIRFGAAVPTQVPVAQQGGGTITHTAMISSRELICVSPCDTWVDGRKGQQFVVVGDATPESDPFRLHDREGNVTIRVDSGSFGGLTGGMYLTVLGISGVVLGPTFLGMAYALPDTEHNVETGEDIDLGPNGTFLTFGGISAAIGALGLAAGIPLWLLSGTDHEVNSAGSLVPRIAGNGDLRWSF